MAHFICTAKTGYAGQEKRWLHKASAESVALADFEDTAVEYIESWDNMNGINSQEYDEDEEGDIDIIEDDDYDEGVEREYDYFVKEIEENEYLTLLAAGEFDELDCESDC